MTQANPAINLKGMTDEAFCEYCQMYLVQHLIEDGVCIPYVEYREVSHTISCIDWDLFLGLRNETGKLLLINKIYQLFQFIDVNLEKSKLSIYVDYLSTRYM